VAIIVLDPGHGGKTKIGGSDPNHAKGPSGLLEKTATLDIAQRTKKALEAGGQTVVLTRTADINLGLSARAGVAKSIKAPVFVSIHFNGFNQVAQGTETFCHTSHSGKSADLCRGVQAAMVAATGLSDRNKSAPNGVKTLALGVLKPSSHFSGTACILAEISFMDVAAEDARLQTDAYKDKLAKALAKGVTTYLGDLAANTESVLARDVQDGFEAMNAAGAADEAAGTPAETLGARPRAARKPAAGSRASGRAAPKVGIDAHEEIDGTPAAAAEGLEAVVAVPAGFQHFVDGLGLRYFSARELLFLGGSNESGTCAGLNDLPPEALWPNIAKTARMLDEIRHRLGYSVTILSGYRSPDYNRCIGGEAGSLHMRFNAIDFVGSKDNSRTWWEVAKSVRLSDPDFKGGIGYYRVKKFVHIDTRGTNANWKGSGD